MCRTARLAIAALAVLPALTTTAWARASDSGIRGRVTASPTCPVQTVPPQRGCEPAGFAARVRVRRVADRRTVARIRTTGDGRFRVGLRPGRYAIRARPVSGRPYPRCSGWVQATVRAGQYTRVGYGCDTGIR